MGIRQWLQRSNLIRPVNNNRGMALMLAVSTVALIIYLAIEVSYDTSVEYNVNSQELNRLKAYYAARGAIELGLHRVKIYQSVKARFGDQLKNNPYVDYVWNFPIQWPLPTELLGAVDKEEAEEDLEESLLDARYSLEITDEGSKIDINDLNSPSETIRNTTERMLMNLFRERLEYDEAFRKAYGTFKFEELINNIRDWMSPKWASANGGDKRARYSEFQNQEFPPNRAFRTIGELRMIPMMDDELFEFLLPRVTIYGLKAVNPNTATLEALMSLDSGITREVANEIKTQREKQPFSSAQDFYSFVASKAQSRLQARGGDEWPLTFGTLTSFRVEATGEFAGVTRKITAITMDITTTANIVKEYVDKEKKDPNSPDDPSKPASGNTQTSGQKKQSETLPKGPPRIVYWNEQ